MNRVFDRSNPLMYVTNTSKVITDDQLRPMLLAIQKQITHDFFPAWGTKCQLIMPSETHLSPIDARAMSIIITDDSDDPTAAGYHFNPGGWPETRVFAKGDFEEGGLAAVSVTLSHEVMEMLVDPAVNLYAIGPAKVNGKSRSVIYPYEVCDPVQGGKYAIDGVMVSDFVFPEWFEPERHAGEVAVNYRGTLRRPFQIEAKGYVSFLYAGKWHEVWGKERTKKPGRHRQMIRSNVAEPERWATHPLVTSDAT